MDDTEFQAARHALAAARRDARLIEPFDGRWVPADLAEAYRLQRAVAGDLAGEDGTGGGIGGWKVMAITPAQQSALQVAMPVSAPLLLAYMKDGSGDGATWPMASWVAPRLECEFAFELAVDLPPRPARPYLRAEVEAALAGLRIAIEIVDARVPLGPAAPFVGVALADALNNGGFAHGPLIDRWREVDFASHAIVLNAERAGTRSEFARGDGRSILDGDPLGAVVMLANAQADEARSLRAGDIVTTGSCTGAPYAPGPGRYEADFGALGRIAVALA